MAARKKPASKAVAKKKTTTPASVDIMDDAGAGSENITSDDISVPRLAILQPLSKGALKSNSEYIEGAEAGMIYESSTRRLLEEDQRIIPIGFRKTHIEWWPHGSKKGQGFVADHGEDPDTSNWAKEEWLWVSKEGTEIIPTAEYLVIMINEDGSYAPALLSMSKSQWKRARQWNSMMTGLLVDRPDGKGKINPAWFYRSYTLSTLAESNSEGDWFTWGVTPSDFTLELDNGEEIYLTARELHKQFIAGDIKSAPPSEDGGGGDPDAFG